MVFRQPSKQLLILLGFFCLSSTAAFPQGAALEDAEQQRIIEAMSAEIRTLVTQNNFAGAIAKATELQTIDPTNASATVWKEYSERQLSGPQESRLEKLLGVAAKFGQNIQPASDDEASNVSTTEGSTDIEVAALPPSIPSAGTEPSTAGTPAQTSGSQSTTTPVAPADDPFSDPVSTPSGQVPENPFTNPPANTTTTPDATTPSGTEVAVVVEPTPAEVFVPSPTPPAPISVPERSSSTSIYIYITVAISIILVVGLLYFVMKKNAAAKQTAQPKPKAVEPKATPAKAATVAKTSPTGYGAVNDAVTQAPLDDKTKDDMPLSAPSFGMADPITRFGKDKQTNSDLPTKDGKTASDHPTRDGQTRDGKTAQDPPSFAEGDDALYQSLADDDNMSETLDLGKPNINDSEIEDTAPEKEGITLGGLSFDADNETKAPAAAPKKIAIDENTGEMTFGSIMFNDEGETKGVPKAPEKPKQREEDDADDMSFNSMMFGGNENKVDSRQGLPPSQRNKVDSRQGLPPSQRTKSDSRQALPPSKRSKSDSRQALPPKPVFVEPLKKAEPAPEPKKPNLFEVESDPNEQTYSSLMFDGEETKMPGLNPQKMTSETRTGEKGFDEIMLDQVDETMAPGLENPDVKDTQPLPGMAETKKLPEKRQMADLDKADTKKYPNKSPEDLDKDDTKPLRKDAGKNDDDFEDTIKL